MFFRAKFKDNIVQDALVEADNEKHARELLKKNEWHGCGYGFEDLSSVIPIKDLYELVELIKSEEVGLPDW